MSDQQGNVGPYGETSGPKDGQPGGFNPIPVPNQQPTQPPAYGAPQPPATPYGAPQPPAQGDGASAAPASAGQKQDVLGGLTAAGGTIALILFFICGFALDGWAWAWLFFLIPPLLMAYRRGAGR